MNHYHQPTRRKRAALKLRAPLVAIAALLAITATAGCTNDSANNYRPSTAVMESDISYGLTKQLGNDGVEIDVTSIRCLEVDDQGAKCIAKVNYPDLDANERVPVDVTYTKGERYIWETR